MISPYFHSVQSTSKNYAAALSNGFLATDGTGKPAIVYDNAALYDLFNPAARAYAFAAVQAGFVPNTQLQDVTQAPSLTSRL